jgi:hypothetical protein
MTSVKCVGRRREPCRAVVFQALTMKRSSCENQTLRDGHQLPSLNEARVRHSQFQNFQSGRLLSLYWPTVMISAQSFDQD